MLTGTLLDPLTAWNRDGGADEVLHQCREVRGRFPEATAFLFSLLSESAIPPLVSAVWFSRSTFTVSFEAAVKRSCVGKDSRMPTLPE